MIVGYTPKNGQKRKRIVRAWFYTKCSDRTIAWLNRVEIIDEWKYGFDGHWSNISRNAIPHRSFRQRFFPTKTTDAIVTS